MPFTQTAKKAAKTLLIILILLVFLFPIYWMIITSFKPEFEALLYPPTYYPTQFTLNAYLKGISRYRGWDSFIDSIQVAAGSTMLALTIGIPAAYSFSRYYHQIPKRKDLLFFILSTRILPPIVFIVPFFLLFKWSGLLDTPICLWIVNLTFNMPFVVWVMKGMFDEIPKELDQAAMLDGCSSLLVFRKIILPLCYPSIIVTALFCWIWSWNEFLFASLLTSARVRTIQVLIPSLVLSPVVEWSAYCAIGVLSTLPVVAFIYLIRKHLVRGLTFGIVK
jgi:multiple sugar transport system permease protein